MAAPDHRLQGREDLLVGQVAGGAEEHQRVGTRRRHRGTSLRGGGLFHVAAERVTHRGQQFVGEVGLAARAEAIVSAALITGAGADSSMAAIDRPAALAGIRDPALELRQIRALQKRHRRQVQQPRGDHAAAAPDLGDVGQIQVVLIVFGVAQRSSLGIDRLADACPTLA